MRLLIQNMLISLVVILTVGGCAHSVHLIHASDFEGVVPYEKAEQIVVETSQNVILGFAFDSDYVEQAYEKLLARCSGKITGLTTKYSTALSFLSWNNRLRIEGSCIRR